VSRLVSDLQNRASDAAAQAKAYVAGLMAALGSRDPMQVLADMPAALRQAVSGLSPEQEVTPEAAGKWSVKQVVQHLADSELVGGFRFRMVLTHDSPSLPGYDQDLWAERLHYQDSDLPTALNDFATLRAGNLRLLRTAAPEDMHRIMRHAERGDETLEQMIRGYAGHDLVHLRQIARIRRAIGAPPAASAS
jgi:DinB superfamily